MGFEGFRSDGVSHLLPINSAARLDHLRLERGALRKDFGWARIGLAAPSRILGLIEHKFIFQGQTFSRLARLFKEGGQPKIQVWDGAGWIDAAVSPDPIESDVNVSIISTLGNVFIADGKRILRWGEDRPLLLQEDDYPPGTILNAVGEFGAVLVDPGGAYNQNYETHYSVDLAGAQDIAVTLKLLVNNQILASRRIYVLAAGLPLSLPHELFEFSAADLAPPTNSVQIHLVSITRGDLHRTDVTDGIFLDSGVPEWKGAKSTTERAWDDTYNLEYIVNAADHPVTVQFYYTRNGIEWHIAGEWEHPQGASGTFTRPAIIPALTEAAAEWGFHYIIGGSGGSAGAAPLGVHYAWEAATTSTASVKLFNKAVDADPAAGVTYSLLGDPVSVFELLSPDAPGARYVFPFGDRLLALHDDGDRQALAWSADGDPSVWTGTDTGLIFLVDGQIDPIDDLMAGAAIGHNLAALYRRRSIMRIQETGNPLQSISAVDWIPGLGTEAPFSVQIIPGGNIFLGHNRMVYILEPSGQRTPVGAPIRNELVKVLTDNVELVDSAYDSALEEYWLGIPELGADHITAVWILDVGAAIRGEGIFWRRREANIRRFATLGTL